jgi:hypothetical protein
VATLVRMLRISARTEADAAATRFASPGRALVPMMAAAVCAAVRRVLVSDSRCLDKVFHVSSFLSSPLKTEPSECRSVLKRTFRQNL